MKEKDIFDTVLDFITTTKRSLIIYSRDFNVTLYFNVDINNEIMSLLQSGKNIDINYEIPEGTGRIFTGLKTKYTNFSFSKTKDKSKEEDRLPDFIIKDDTEMIIFRDNNYSINQIEERIKGAKKILNDIKLNSPK